MANESRLARTSFAGIKLPDRWVKRSSVRVKTLVGMGAAMVGLIVMLYAVLPGMIQGTFNALDYQMTQRRLERAMKSLNDETDQLDAVAANWAESDDTYDFMGSPNDAYIRANATDNTLSNLRLSALIYIRNDGSIVLSKGYDLDTHRAVEIPAALTSHLNLHDSLLAAALRGRPLSGLLILDDRPFLVSVRPILTSQGDGPVRGALVFGRWLNAGEVQRIAGEVQSDIVLVPLERALQDPVLGQLAAQANGRDRELVRAVDARHIAACSLLNDVYLQPRLLAYVTASRDILELGETALQNYGSTLLAVILAFCVAAFYLLERIVLSRLLGLTTQLRDLTLSGDPGARVNLGGNDEISALGQTINGLLAETQGLLAAAERQNQETALLDKVRRAMACELDLQMIFRTIVQAISETFGYTLVSIYLREGDELVLQHQVGYKDVLERLPMDRGIMAAVARDGKPALVVDVRGDPRFLEAVPGVQSELCAPLLSDEGVVGVLNVESANGIPLTDGDLGLMVALCEHVTIALQRATLYTAAQQELVERKRAQAALRLAADELETRVRERTSDLAAVNAALEESNSILANEVYERQRAEDTLNVAHKQLEQILRSIPMLLIVLDKSVRIVHWNAISEQVLGLAAERVTGQALLDLGLPWENERLAKALDEARAGSHPVSVGDLRYTRPDGKPGFLDVTVISFPEASRDMGFLLLAEETTRRKILEGQLSQAQKLESIGRLAAGVAHEINTPMQYVGDNTRFLKDSFGDLARVYPEILSLIDASHEGQNLGPLIENVDRLLTEYDAGYLLQEIPTAIDQTLDGVSRVTQIVRALKEFSHPDVGEKTPIDINRALESTLTVTRNEWKYVAEVVSDYEPGLPPVPCLPGELNQAILNIIINARDAITDVRRDGQTEKGKIGVSTRGMGDCVEIRISDTGTGIPEEVRPRIFDPFFTTKEVGRGSGQGLAIAHSVIVDKHNGSLKFETEIGKGTVFIVRLPIAAAAPVERGSDSETRLETHGR